MIMLFTAYHFCNKIYNAFTRKDTTMKEGRIWNPNPGRDDNNFFKPKPYVFSKACLSLASVCHGDTVRNLV